MSDDAQIKTTGPTRVASHETLPDDRQPGLLITDDAQTQAARPRPTKVRIIKCPPLAFVTCGQVPNYPFDEADFGPVL